ncbi:hypothetical protein [Geoalkalibacter halelectricus]|uniref:hypothetical protein n=1 Tax=Geoalkalibacter halelectricus TaxID=2847045 RepID=UPI003D1DA227
MIAECCAFIAAMGKTADAHQRFAPTTQRRGRGKIKRVGEGSIFSSGYRTPLKPKDQKHEKKNRKDTAKNFADFVHGSGNVEKHQNKGDTGDGEKNCGQIQH